MLVEISEVWFKVALGDKRFSLVVRLTDAICGLVGSEMMA